MPTDASAERSPARKSAKRARSKKKAKQPQTDERLVVWRSGRAYGDFRSYDDVGGGREALAPAGRSWGTNDAAIANALYDARLEALKVKRRKHAGVKADEIRPTTLAKLVRLHLIRKADADFSDQHMRDLEKRLTVALDHFGRARDPRTVDPDDVREWAKELAADGTRKPGTCRHYLNALSGLYGRAQEGRHVAPGYNPVQAMQEKPTGMTSRPEARFFEVHDAALLLEAARVLEARDRINATPGLHAIIATFFLTGGRRSEVLGLDVEDVSFDRGLIWFRPNVHRRLKTSTSHRVVPIWPQLEEILRAYVFGGAGPVAGLLFPSNHGGMVDNLRKSLDEIGKLAGLEEGEVRTRAFRHSYCSARLQTFERIIRPGMDPADPDPWDYIEVPRDRVSREMGHGGTQLVARIYGHAPRSPHRADAVEYRVEAHREQLGERLTALMAAR